MLDCQHSGGGKNDVMTRISLVLYDCVCGQGDAFYACLGQPSESNLSLASQTATGL